MKQKTLQVGEEMKFTFCTTTLEQNDCTVLYETTVVCTLDIITLKRILTQFTKIYVDWAMLQTPCKCRRNLHILNVRSDRVDGW